MKRKGGKICLLGQKVKLSEILENTYAEPFDYKSFREATIKKFYAEESIFFLETLKKIQKPVEKADVRLMITDFLTSGGKYELNIESTMRAVTSKLLNEMLLKESILFDDFNQIIQPVKEHIMSILRDDILQKYVKMITIKKQLNFSKKQALWIFHPELSGNC